VISVLLVNLLPDNPYAPPLRQGHFLNFNGLTHLLAALWPGPALAWLWRQYQQQRPAGRALSPRL
jgi:hypothetical protein